MAWFGGSGSKAGTKPPSSSGPPSGKPLLLIGYEDAAKKWVVGQEALDALAQIRGPMAALAVCGRARQGKSFLLNQLLSKFTGSNSSQGFVVSPTHQSCTRGLWVWSSPITINGPGGKCSMLLIDCEGVDAYDQGQQHSAQVFSLAVLLSSVFVYNQLGSIDSIAIERLAMTCQLAKRIKQRSASDAGQQADFHPTFLWLLRDFQLELREGGKTISPKQYLEEVLAELPGSGPDADSRNQTRSTIKTVFPDRDAFTLLRPALTEAELNRLDTLPPSALRPEFRKGMDDLSKLLASRSRPLRVAGQMVNGQAFAGLVRAYVHAINEGAVPELVTAWQGVSRAECARALEAAVEVYSQRFDRKVAGDDEALYAEHQRALAAALEVYHRGALGDAATVSESEALLRTTAEASLAEARRQRAALGEKAAVDMLAKETERLGELMGRPDADLDAVEAELRRFLEEYDRSVAYSAAKYKKVSEWLVNTVVIGVKDIVRRLMGAREEVARRAADLEAELSKAQGELRAAATRAAAAEASAAQLQQELGSARDAGARAAGELAAENRKASEAAAEVQRLRAQLSAAGGKEATLAAQLAAAEAAAASEGGRAAQLQAQLAQLRQQETAASGELASLRATALADRGALERARAQLAEAEQRAQQLQAAQADAAHAELLAARGELAAAQAAAATARVEAQRTDASLAQERSKVTQTLQELAALQQQLAQERQDHDAARAALAAAQRSLEGLRASATPGTPLPSPPPSERAAAPVRAAAGGLASPVKPLPTEPSKMSVAQLKEWVTDSRLEDEEFMRLATTSRTKKADWVEFVQRKARAAGLL